MRYDESDRESKNVEDRRNEEGGSFPFPGFDSGRMESCDTFRAANL